MNKIFRFRTASGRAEMAWIWRRFLSLCLALSIIAGAVPVSFAENDDVLYECKNLKYTTSAGEGTVAGDGTFSLMSASRGIFVEFDIDVPDPGNCTILVNVKKSPSRGIMKASVNNTDLDSLCDLFSENTSNEQVSMGRYTFAEEGTHKIRFTVAGKNKLSSMYTLSLKSIVLRYNDPRRTPAITKADLLNRKLEECAAVFAGSPMGSINGFKSPLVATNSFVTAFESNGEMLVPVDFVAKAFDMKAEVDVAKGTAVLKKEKKTLRFATGNSTVTIDGVQTNAGCKPQVKDGILFVPLKAVAETEQKQVFHDKGGFMAVSDKLLFDAEEDAELMDKAKSHFAAPYMYAQQYIKSMPEADDSFKPTGLTKKYYLDMIELAMREAYSKSELEATAASFKAGVRPDTQTYGRIASAMGILLADGRLLDYRDLWESLMDSCITTACTVRNGNLNDFGVKELVLSYMAMKDKISPEKRAVWEKQLRNFDPYAMYSQVYTKVKSPHNIGIYNLAGEYLRHNEGFTDITDYFANHWPNQFDHFDENGMYIDPNAPMLYDLTTRAQIQLIMGNGYDGEFAEAIDDKLKKGGYMTLLMQSSSYEFPYGGRSNQYHFNEALIAANCEYEASRYKAMGDMKTAGVYKRAAHLAAMSFQRWVEEKPPRQLKNFYPKDSKIGTESYGGYNKYMITMGNFIYIAYMFADDTIPELPTVSETGGYAISTSDTFHKVFANAKGHSLEIDTRAYQGYDATGIGRYHRNGVPSELGLSMSFTSKPDYKLPTGTKGELLSISPGWDKGNGEIQYLSTLSGSLNNDFTVLEESAEQVKFSLTYSGGLIEGCKGVTEIYTINEHGVTIETELLEPVVNTIYYQIPLLVTNGKDVTSMSVSDKKAMVSMLQHSYTVTSDGSMGLRDSIYGNKNGEYKVADIKKSGSKINVNLYLE